MISKPVALLTRKIPDRALDLLKEHVLLEQPEEDMTISRDDLIQAIAHAHGLICLLTDTIDAEVIEAGTKLKVIANYAVGYDNIDTAAATRNGIAVTNTPGVLTETTADLAFALLLSVARRIPEADRFVRNGKFTGWLPGLMLGADVYGKVLGLIGFGRIGRAVARRAQGFKMKILYCEPTRLSRRIEQEYHVEYRPLEGLLRDADFVSIHIPLTEKTYHLIGEHELRLMKNSAFLINTSRGPVIHEKALARALKERCLAGCALDVFENEPEVDPELVDSRNAVIVPHIGSASVETRTRMALMVAEDILDVLVRNRTPTNIVNPEVFRK